MILLTGFEPFGEDTVNPSWLAARRAGDLLAAEGIAVNALELQCVFGESASALTDAIDRLNPDIVVCVGLAGGRGRISLERVAINCDDARIPDNKGQRPIDQEVIPKEVRRRTSQACPSRPRSETFRSQVSRGEVSQSAGTYVCNHVFYALMHSLWHPSGASCGGFVHVPYLPEHLPEGSTAPSMPLDINGGGHRRHRPDGSEQSQGDVKLSAGAIR
jgi:pyroglutamyl-peptidase